MLKINSPHADETFSKIIDENNRKNYLSKIKPKKKNFNRINLKEYSSPFRRNVTNIDKLQLQTLKTERFPTTSATSDYTKLNTKELGFKTIKDSDKRIKDIKFPEYLTQNEIRQAGLLNDLTNKEERLDYWKNSQKILDYTKSIKPTTDIDDLKKNILSNNKLILEGQLEDAKLLNPTYENLKKEEQKAIEEENKIVTAEIPMFTNVAKLYKPVETIKQEEFVVLDSNNQNIINENELIDATDLINRYKVLQKPIDPSLVSKVPYSNPTLATNTSQGQTEADQQVNPIASPEDPEVIVKIGGYGHLSKALYDKVKYESDVHTNYLIDYDEEQTKRYNNKIQRYDTKFKRIQQKKEAILQEMNEMKLRNFEKLEVIQNKLIKDIMNSNSQFAEDKVKILKDTELAKLKKLNECKFYYQKQKLIQHEINSLGVERNLILDDYTEFTTDLNNVSTELDGKLFRLNQINYQNDQIRKEIFDLQGKRTTLQNEIESHKNKDIDNTQKLADMKTGEDEKVKSLNTINDTITDRLNLLAIVKQESNNETLKISKLTDKINLKNKENEAKFKKELEENTTNYEGIITHNETEFEEKIASLEESHKKEVENLTTEYNEAVSSLQKKLSEHEQQKAEATAAAAKAKMTASTDNSLYSYETEEEIIYQ